jgi:hypothetical protein
MTLEPLTTAGSADFADAKVQWENGATVDSAHQGIYWTNAATDLTRAAGAGAPNASAYATADQELRQLVSLPDAMQTPVQNAEFRREVAALNTFFGTPGLYT